MYMLTMNWTPSAIANLIDRTPAPFRREKVMNGDLVVNLVALRNGDRQELEFVLRELLPRVRRWLLRLLGPRSDLDDATQDALIALAGALPRFKGESKLTTFAHRIVLRTSYRYFRRRKREEKLTLVPAPPDTVDPEARVMGREALRQLYRCLERLPKKRRVAFVLCCIEGLSPAEAAELEGVSGVAMRSRLSHARAEVLRRVGHDFDLGRVGQS